MMMSYVIFRDFVPVGVIWCADFEFGIRLPFICVEIGSLEPKKYPKENGNFYDIFNFDPPKTGRMGLKGIA